MLFLTLFAHTLTRWTSSYLIKDRLFRRKYLKIINSKMHSKMQQTINEKCYFFVKNGTWHYLGVTEVRDNNTDVATYLVTLLRALSGVAVLAARRLQDLANNSQVTQQWHSNNESWSRDCPWQYYGIKWYMATLPQTACVEQLIAPFHLNSNLFFIFYPVIVLCLFYLKQH